MPTDSMPTQFASEYTSQFAYTVCLTMPTHITLHTVSYTQTLTYQQFLKSQISKYFTEIFYE